MKKIGLVFQGGGLKGSYQIGSYYAFRRCHIKIDGIVGTSIGSFNAAAIVCGNYKRLLNMWENIDTGKILEFNDVIVEAIANKRFSLKSLIFLEKDVLSILKNRGIDTKNMRLLAESLVNESDLKKSKMDFGLVTVKLNKLKPVYLFKEDIKNGTLIDSLIASCSLPLFRLDPIIDNHIYVDGGFYDNTPSKMLIDKNYDIIYEIKIDGIGRDKKVDRIKNNIITIKPSRNIASILELNNKIIRENINIGYYDTLRVLKNYDGYKYCFIHYSDRFISFLLRNVSKRELKRIKMFFNCNNRDAVIKSLEYVMEKEGFDYYKVYSIFIIIIKLKKIKCKNNFVYSFIKKLRII